ncbi:MAG TPA: metal-dependent hydrolase [Burkholderiales bacterium]|jgi:L-ascorbate metabolism protein UlaG (beta-lactamase superfamily)|nr:metal-dependent hydrolase [Burkholderiales bacterium]
MKHALRNIAGIMAALALLAGCATAPAPDSGKSGGIEVLWLGQSAMRITTVNGKVILVDPFLTANPKTPPQYKNLDALGKIDLILVTHGHGDHLGDAPALSKKHNVPLYGPAGLNQALTTLGILSADLSQRFGKGGTITPFPGVKITATHAEHSSEILWTNPATNKPESHIGGEPVGFIIELENGFKIYHMGDTGIFGDMKLIGEYYKPDLIMIPIGGHFVMSPVDAAYVTNNFLKPRFAIPMHYGTIPVLKGTPQEYIGALGNSSTKVFPINPGDKLNF